MVARFLVLLAVATLLCNVEASENKTDCSKFSGSSTTNNCNECVRHASCMYCYADNKCKQYPVGKLLPGPADCPLGDARWGTCFINFLALIICMSILAFLLLVVLPCSVYCCCCRRKSGPSRRTLAANARYEDERTERETRYTERRAEREKKYDEIRSKYGLATHGSRPEGGYRQFNNEA